jgi:hypothetical protein
MPLRSAVLALALGAVALAVAAPGCNSDAVGVDACKAIEEARCRQAPNCPNSVQVSPPLYFTSGSDVDACIRFYDTACAHGLAVGDPGTTAVNKCVDAINNGSCDVVADPGDNAPDCAWLSPPDAGDDGSGDGAPDAAPDGDDAG